MKGHTYQRGKTWSWICEVGVDVTGRRRQRTKGGFATQKEADKALRATLKALDDGGYIEPSKETVAAYLTAWLNSLHDLRPSTVRVYTWAVTQHLIPQLGFVKLQELTALRIDAMASALREAGAGAKTISYCYTVLRKALSDAFQAGRIAQNPALRAKRPRPGARKEMQIWAAAQLRQFFDSLPEDDRYRPVYLVAATTGARRGEVLGLRWKDVDLANGWLTIQQAVAMVGSKVIIGPPKTKSSRRMVALDEHTVNILIAHRVQEQAKRLALGLPAPAGDALVFSELDGRPLNPKSTTDTFQRRAKAAGLPVIAFHGLRHTHATMALQMNIHPKVISERLGHSSIKMTLDIYSHAIPAMQADAAAQVAAHLFES